MKSPNTTNGSARISNRKPASQAANDHAQEIERLSAWQRLQAAYDDFIATCGVGSEKRRIIAVVVGVVSYAFTLAAGVMIADYLITAAVMAGAGTFLTIVASVLAIVTIASVSMAVGQLTYDMAMAFDAKALAERATSFKDAVVSGTQSAFTSVGRWFEKKPAAPVVATAPSAVQ